MVRSVNIEVYCDTSEGEREVFAVISDHRPDLPKPFDEEVQRWAVEQFPDLGGGDEIPEAGELIYEPDGNIVEIKRK
jgi:hypothetical protein